MLLARDFLETWHGLAESQCHCACICVASSRRRSGASIVTIVGTLEKGCFSAALAEQWLFVRAMHELRHPCAGVYLVCFLSSLGRVQWLAN